MPTGSELLNLKLMSYKSRGKTYVRAYRNKWVVPTPEEAAAGKKGRSVPDIQVQVGVLEPDGRVKMSSKFLARFPAFASDDWYYRDHELVKKARQKVKSKAKAKVNDCDLGADESLSPLSFRLLRALARQSGIEAALLDTFGRREAELWLSLALFKTLSKEASADDWIDCYVDWADFHESSPEIFQPLSDEALREFLDSLTESDWDAFWQARRDGLKDRPSDSPRFALFDLSTIVEANSQTRRQGPLREHLAVLCDRATGRFVAAFPFAGPLDDPEAPGYCVKRAETLGIPARELLLVGEGRDGLGVTGASYLISLPIADGSQEAERIRRESRNIYHQIETWDPYHAVNAMTFPEEKDGRSRSFTHLLVDAMVQARVRIDIQRLALEYVSVRRQGLPLDERRFEKIRAFIKEGAAADAPFGDMIDNDLLNREADLAGWLTLETDTVENTSEAISLYKQFVELNARFGQYRAEFAARTPQPADIRRAERLLFTLSAEFESRFNRNRLTQGSRLDPDLRDLSFARLLGILERRNRALGGALPNPISEEAAEQLGLLFGSRLPLTARED